jgi:cytidine deaminase
VAVPVDPGDLDPADRELVELAVRMRDRAYAPYSEYRVGAAVRAADGGLYGGANLEGVDYTLTTHAEMHALNAMRLATDAPAVALAFSTGSAAEIPMSCGLCRQRLREFAATLDVPVYAVSLRDGAVARIHRATLDEILPYSFGPASLGRSDAARGA